MTGGLYDPLGTDRGEPRGGSSRRLALLSAPTLVAGALVVGLAVLLLVSWLRDTGDRGQPVAVGPIERVQAPPKPPAPAPPVARAPPAEAQPAATLPALADQDVEIQNGVRIVRPRRGPQAPGGQTLSVPDAGAAR